MPNINEILLHSFKNENITVSDSQLAQFIRYYELLLEWNEKINLTAITEPADVAVKHFADSLLALKMLPDDNWQNKKMIDIGTGAGFPAIPLKIMKQSLDVILFDSLQKRLNFLDTVCQELALANIRTVHGRAEDSGQDKTMREQYDIACARAVAKMPVLLEYTLPFVKVGGYFIALKGPELDDELVQSQKALQTLGGEIKNVGHFTLSDGTYTRNIALIQKVKSTPKTHPRKAGTPQKKPLL